jgi:hypothetical protein
LINLYIAVDPKTQELIPIDIADDQIADSCMLPKLLEKSPKSVKKCYMMVLMKEQVAGKIS